MSGFNISRRMVQLKPTIHGEWGSAIAVTISSGVLTLSKSGIYIIDTEGGAATDNLTKIAGLSYGDEVILMLASASRVITLKNGANLQIGFDFTLNNVYDTATLLCVGSDICCGKGNFASNGD